MSFEGEDGLAEGGEGGFEFGEEGLLDEGAFGGGGGVGFAGWAFEPAQGGGEVGGQGVEGVRVVEVEVVGDVFVVAGLFVGGGGAGGWGPGGGGGGGGRGAEELDLVVGGDGVEEEAEDKYFAHIIMSGGNVYRQ